MEKLRELVVGILKGEYEDDWVMPIVLQVWVDGGITGEERDDLAGKARLAYRVHRELAILRGMPRQGPARSEKTDQIISFLGDCKDSFVDWPEALAVLDLTIETTELARSGY